MTYPHSPQPGPRPGPPPGGFRPGPPPGYRPVPSAEADTGADRTSEYGDPERPAGQSTGHPVVDAVLRSLENAAQLPPAEQIAAYEAAHRVLQETLSGIDG